ncbi:hypothetical protein [Paraburkholderia caballeronis]|uniref:Helix-turn-helix domain-containing protein n=1 Tax=Paraburkholderia caballeronis TaxID=416943 RepID=A0A1H7KZW9_9BURK|nr:hypothetical protein [Paraburkholderia caballeronis]PXW28236.1 hypothetical protein C7403_102128 [Paraburkholderia caballeronis]PXX03602.1 hypothetical protein C7407_102128 [Paraburkholderia caballeronis]RAK04346.1 hypothetical protein C7409_102128 [Paraburkholderia caballeronis]SED83930.1 hypothetical protein SAMN05445871_4051 [Paraburkholderia caballeronis]SEK92331.1 hypothetical protein SAMN05192542_104128 [Paraburkholderia caballeronis]
MSLIHEVEAWEFELPGLKKLVLLAVARMAGRPSLEALVHVPRLALQCGISESAARKYLGALEADGYFTASKDGRVLRIRLALENPVWSNSR